MTTTRAAIYARISSADEDDHLGIHRQIKDCAELATRKGWTIEDTYPDPNVSATRSARRPQYERMLADVRSGRITGIVVWDVDRLSRTPRELEDIIDLADTFGLELASVGGEIDLATPQGRLMARIKGNVGRHDTDQMSRRIKRTFDQRAERQLPHGIHAYGYERVIVEKDSRGKIVQAHDSVNEAQAKVIRLAASLLLSGVSLRATAVELNTQKHSSPRGVPWTSSTLRQILVRERNAGWRIHRKVIVRDSDGTPVRAWPSVYETADTDHAAAVDIHTRVVALLRDPERKTNNLGSTRKHLLSGLAICGCCGSNYIAVNNRSGDRDRSQPAAYCCKACSKIRRKQAAVDVVVESYMVDWLSNPEALTALATGDTLEVERAQAELESCQAKLRLAAEQFADSDDEDGLLVLARIKAKLQPRIDSAKAVLRANVPAAVPVDMAGPNAQANWDAAPLDVKRELIRLVCTVTIMPSTTGRVFDPSSVKIEPL
jgi:DNA invertase Pin-like site-specific DNA recombinase